ncbi:MAG: cysteine synthase A [Erysipelothrix sp.]|nr:cysteine synthase A [Erysipelothrix sp.]
MSNIKQSITELVGNTPLLELKHLEETEGLSAKIIGKLEYLNVAGSVKDRIALNMIRTAEQAGVLKPDSIIVEATSGNTGIGLAAIGTALGYEVVLVMPETMTLERRKFLKGYGAKLELTPGTGGMKAAIARALEMKKENDKVFIPSQFENNANVMVHYETTGPEIYRDTDGAVDVLVSGVGTGGTITGAGSFLREKNPQLHIVAVEPKNSPVLSGGQPGTHKIQGIGAGFVPKILDTEIYDEIIQIEDTQAIAMAKRLGQSEGVLVGISSGAAVVAAVEVAKRPEFAGKNIVVVLPDSGDRYLSTAMFED